jgi:threonine/homoserine/homoserine lactone efflux protein
MTQSFWLFILSTVGISLSGVMLPGPLTAATIASGYRDKNAGLMIGIGHGIIEIPIIALVYFGFASYLSIPVVKQVTGVAGGLLLVVMGLLIFFTIKKPVEAAQKLTYSPLVTGMVMTGGNPYFLLWWATIGVALITSAITFGAMGMIVFVVLHLACDIGWDQFLSMTVFKTKHLWTPGVQKTIFSICALVLIGFGIYFGVSVFTSA